MKRYRYFAMSADEFASFAQYGGAAIKDIKKAVANGEYTAPHAKVLMTSLGFSGAQADKMLADVAPEVLQQQPVPTEPATGPAKPGKLSESKTLTRTQGKLSMYELKTRAFEVQGATLTQVVEAYIKQRTLWPDYADLEITSVERMVLPEKRLMEALKSIFGERCLDAEPDCKARELFSAVCRILDEVVLQDDEEHSKLSNWLDEAKGAACEIIIGEHDWELDQCNFWGHSYCFRCGASKYPELARRACADFRAEHGTMTEKEYIASCKAANAAERAELN